MQIFNCVHLDIFVKLGKFPTNIGLKEVIRTSE